MDILYLLIPLSAVLVLMIIAVFGWALHGGQFDDLEREGQRILDEKVGMFDGRQSSTQNLPEESRPSPSITDHFGQS